jgi:hypothetical protein
VVLRGGFAKNGRDLWFCGGQNVVNCMVKRGELCGDSATKK